ncbi:MAG: PRC-barrel domain-containing protein [Candidatus Thorarchaeota archaeon]|nr:MAG: PRC-barrel domain-containing protein [Candidatus Thorarchaeota archaeon]
MMTMELTRSFCCRELKKLDVVDSKDKKIGKITDFTFTFDGNLRLSQFILAGPRLEEFLEAIRVIPDKDPLFNASFIEKFGNKIHLSTTVDNLKTTLDDEAIPEGEIRLTKLEKLDIFDKDGVKVGRTIDVDFDVDGSAWLTVGGSFFEEKLEAIGLREDIDIIVPTNVIESIGDDVRLLVTKDNLGTTMDEILKNKSADLRRMRTDAETRRDIAKVRLHALRPV